MGRHHALLSLHLLVTPFVTRAGADIGICSDGRRQVLRAGAIIALVDAEGRVTSFVPERLDEPRSATHETALASLSDPKNEDWVSAAVELGRRGGAAGENPLIAMPLRQVLLRAEEEPELGTRFLIREQVELCELLGELSRKAADASLARAESSPHEVVRDAANAALKPSDAR